MIKLYYSNFSCAMVVHIVLELLKADYEAIKVQIWSEDYKKIAPKWAVPAIIDTEVWDEAMTQIVAILKYLLKKYPNNNIWSDWNIVNDYKLDNVLSFLNSDLHTSFWWAFASQKFTTKTDEESLKAVKEASFLRINRQLWFLDEMLENSDFLVWNKLSVADIYAFVIVRWAVYIIPEWIWSFKNISKFYANISKIQEVQKIMEIHGN